MTIPEPKTQFRSFAIFTEAPAHPVERSKPGSLMDSVRAAIEGIDPHTLRPVARVDAGLAFQPRTLLALMLYCYSHGIYGSADIEDAIRRDTNFRRLCRQEFPDARLLRRFRRENSTVLQSALAELLRRITERQGVEGFETVDFAGEADRRIRKAMFIDTMEVAA